MLDDERMTVAAPTRPSPPLHLGSAIEAGRQCESMEGRKAGADETAGAPKRLAAQLRCICQPVLCAQQAAQA